MHNSISFWKAGDLLGEFSAEAVVYGSGISTSICMLHTKLLSSERKKNATKIESVRIKVVSEVFYSVLLRMCMMVLSLVASSGFIFSAGPLPHSGMTWIFSGVELGLSNERHCVMQG